MDHVFPKSWYSPTATPPNEEKPQVPSCEPCNKSLGKVESRLLRVLPLSTSPENRLADGAYDVMSSSVNPTAGRNARDSDARKQQAHALHRRMGILKPDLAAQFDMVPTPETLVVTDEAGQVVGHRALRVEPEDQRSFIRKMLRGFLRWHFDYVLAIDANVAFQQLERPDRAAHAEKMKVGLEGVREWRVGGGSLVYSVGWVRGLQDHVYWTFFIWDELGYTANVTAPHLRDETRPGSQ
jgi:hypothetical protein